MMLVYIGRSLLIFSNVTFKMAAWWPYWIFRFPDSNFRLALNIKCKLEYHITGVYRQKPIFSDATFKMATWWPYCFLNFFFLFHFFLGGGGVPGSSYPRPVLAFGYCRCLRLFVCVCVRPCVNHELVRAITHHPFQLGSPNVDQRCKIPWLRSLLFCGTIDRDLQGQIELQSQNLPHFELVHAITHHQLKLQFPNLEQKCILALFKSLPILVLIEIDLQFNLEFQTQTKLSFLCTSLAFFSETS